MGKQTRPDPMSPMEMGSSPLSWQTAPSTPLMVEDAEEALLGQALIKYRAAKQLPSELRMSCRIHFEEKLFSNALSLENDLLLSPSNPDEPSFVAPISHIALAGTLLVHPNLTTRSKEVRDHSETLPKALTYLRNLLAIVGPGNAKLSEAFTFRPQNNRRGYVSKKHNPRSSSSDSDEAESDDITLPLASNESLWMRAQDFWHVVGWAFNCSVTYKERWEYWKLWLNYMLDVIDADWLERQQRDSEAWENLKQEDAMAEEIFEARGDSILSQYASSHRGRTHVKRVIRSIFANGEGSFLNEFPEVFAKETLMVKKQDDSRKKQKFGQVDLENGNFGGYGSSDDDENNENMEFNSSQQELESSAPVPEDIDYHESEGELSLTLGGHESMTLRLRLMALLSKASFSLSEDAIPLRELYDRFVDNLFSMPVQSLSLFIGTNSIPDFPLAGLSSLCQVIIPKFIDNKAPSPDSDDLDVESLVECYLPWAASTTSVEENTKLSLLIETLLRLYVQEPTFKYESSPDDLARLKRALEKGIKAREAKVNSDKRRKRSKSRSEDAAKFKLQCSGERMQLLMPIYEKKVQQARSIYESSQSQA